MILILPPDPLINIYGFTPCVLPPGWIRIEFISPPETLITTAFPEPLVDCTISTSNPLALNMSAISFALFPHSDLGLAFIASIVKSCCVLFCPSILCHLKLYKS